MADYGTPGGSLARLQADFGTERVEAGRRGERQTAALLRSMQSRDSAIHVFHDLKMPGRSKANIDHVVVRGRTVIVVDSKLWAPGVYWSFLGPRRGLRYFEPASRAAGIAKQVLALRSYLGSTARVKALVVIHSSDKSRPVRTGLLRIRGGARHCDGARAQARLIAMLGSGITSTPPELLTRLLSLVR